jgi:hypothetical protein
VAAFRGTAIRDLLDCPKMKPFAHLKEEIMQFDYIRGIMNPKGGIHVEYHVTNEEEPGQVLHEEDMSGKSDKEIIKILRNLSEDFQSKDFSKITIDRAWYNHAQGNHD